MHTATIDGEIQELLNVSFRTPFILLAIFRLQVQRIVLADHDEWCFIEL